MTIKPGETVFITSERGTISGYVLAARQEWHDWDGADDPMGTTSPEPAETTLTIKIQEKL